MKICSVKPRILEVIKSPIFRFLLFLTRYLTIKKTITKWETFTTHNAAKYICLSKDNTDIFYHTPNKTLLYIVHIPDNEQLSCLNDYLKYYQNLKAQVSISPNQYEGFEDAVIINDWEKFRDKVYHTIEAL